MSHLPFCLVMTSFNRKFLSPNSSSITMRTPIRRCLVCSGAGPSILVFYERGHETVCELVQRVFAAHGRESEVMHTGLAACGYELA